MKAMLKKIKKHISDNIECVTCEELKLYSKIINTIQSKTFTCLLSKSKK